MLLALTGGVPGFTSIPLPKSFRSMSICNMSTQKNCTFKIKTSLRIDTESHMQTVQYLAGGWLHHVVVWAHDASVWLGDWGLSVDAWGLGLRRCGGECQQGLAST